MNVWGRARLVHIVFGGGVFVCYGKPFSLIGMHGTNYDLYEYEYWENS